MPSDPVSARIAARIGAHSMHALYDARETTAAARAAFLAGFEIKVDPRGLLAPDERARRAESLRRAHFLQLARRSAEARRRSGVPRHAEPTT